MEIAQTILLGLILVSLVVNIWQHNRESSLPIEFKRISKEDRYI